MEILFSQVREDPTIELYVINNYLNNKDISGLFIGSGGCTILSVISDRIKNIDVVDNNMCQLFLIQLKITIIKYLKNKNKILNFFEGDMNKTEYDNILKDVSNNLSKNCLEYWLNNKDFIYNGINQSGKFEIIFKELVNNNFDFEKVFSRDYLIGIFGESAVINSLNKEFSDHFKEIMNVYKNNYLPEENYFYYQILNNR